MGKLYVTEFAEMGSVGRTADVGGVPQAAKLPFLLTQVVNYTASVASAPFGERTRFVRVHTDSACHITVEDNPTATTSMARMAADQTEYFCVNPGQRIAAVNA